ncbi:MAG: ATP-dependent DNA helicase [bacterium]
MTNLLDELNEEQREAVSHKGSPLLIIAGAGTGKTSVITKRIAWLITEEKIPSSEILATTFSDKAAYEMENRVDVLIPYGYTNYTISTFHSFGDRILRDNALEMGLPPDFKVLTNAEQVIFLRENLFGFPLKRYRPLTNPTRYLQALTKLIARCKDEDIKPSEYIEYVEALPSETEEDKDYKERQIELCYSYKKYEEMMRKNGFIDFGDQIVLVLKLFRENPHILKSYKERYRHILVDEFQDTNFSQFQMLKMLASENITVVSDDDQSIYKFRGAAISNILNFQSFFPNNKIIVLKKNYRSSQPILDTSYKLIQYNNPDRLEYKEGIDKHLIGRTQDGKLPIFIHYEDGTGEADAIGKIIKEKIGQGENPSSFAILVRANSDAEIYKRTLNLLGIPSYFSGDTGLYFQPEVKTLIAFLRVINNPDDTLSLYYLSQSDIYQINQYDLARLMAESSNKKRSLWFVFNNPDIEILEETKQIIERIKDEITRFISLSARLSPGEILYQFLSLSYILELTGNLSKENERKLLNIGRFFEIIKNIQPLLRYNRIPELVSYLDLLIESGDDPGAVEPEPEEELVKILTVHKAKGLEFKYVFIPHLVQRHFPSSDRPDLLEIPEALIKDILPSGDFHLQEERRLFYVAMTRAKDELYLSSARDYGTKRPWKTSQFVSEALDIPKEKPQSSPIMDKIEMVRDVEVEIGDKEKEGLITLSHYQIDDYITCPLKYRYVHILKGFIQKHPSVIYGNSLHQAISFYYKRKREKKPVSLSDIQNIFEKTWICEGFISREHEEKMIDEGKNVLSRFYEEEEKKGIIPTYVEMDFKVMLEDDIRLIGRFDRVDIDGNNVLISDFKSGDITSQEKADKRVKENLQLAIYAFAWNRLFNKIPKVSLIFLSSGLQGFYELKDIDLDKTEEKIKQSADGIRRKLFNPTPAYNNCLYCAYQRICQASFLSH